MCHDLTTVDRGSHRLEVLLLRQARDPLLQLVLHLREPLGSRLVARRAVRPRQLVQPIQQRTRIAHVSANRRVGPPVSVAVEPKVQLHQRPDVVDHRVRVAELTETCIGHPRTDDFVVMELDAFRRDRARLRLADVVQERRRSAAPGPSGRIARPRRRCAAARPCVDGPGLAPAAGPTAPAGTHRPGP